MVLGVGMWIAFVAGGHPGQGAFSFGVMLACGALFVEVAHGNDPAPYSWLGAIGGLAFVAAFLVGRWRS